MDEKEAMTIDTLDQIIDAWESLEGGRNHSKITVQSWLINDMAPAIQKGRDILGRERPRNNEEN